MAEPAPTPSGPLNLLRPLLLLFYSLLYLPPTLLTLLLTLDISTLTSPDALKAAWFARFWVFFGPKSRAFGAASVVPLLRDNARGLCLDIGPGSGEWLDLFAAANNPAITRIVGVEPNAGMHAQLRANAAKAGLGERYEVLGVGAEEVMGKGGLRRGSVDTIITVQCLCSIPDPERVIRELFPLLKPGGRWLVFEHVRTKYRGDVVDYWQKLINVIWPHFFNGCDICRPTDEWLLTVGDWEEVTLRPGAGEGRYDTVPHMVGTLTKRRK